MDRAGCRRIIFSSSATIYGTPHYLPYDEAHPVSPVNVYGRTKAIVEGIIIDWAATDATRSAVLLRYFNLSVRMNPVTSAKTQRASQTIWSPTSRMLPPASGPSFQSLETTMKPAMALGSGIISISPTSRWPYRRHGLSCQSSGCRGVQSWHW